MNFEYLKKLKENDMDCSKSTNDKECEACIMRKMQIKQFPKHNEEKKSATKPFEIVHSDVCGPMQVESKGGSKYMVMFTDYYSGYTMVYFIHSKSEVLSKFKEYVAYVEKQFRHQLKSVLA